MQRLIAWLDKTVTHPDKMFPQTLSGPLPTTLWAFIWYFVKPMKGVVITMAVFNLIYAVLLSRMFWYVGILVEQQNYTAVMLWLGAALILLRLAVGTLAESLIQLIYRPLGGNSVRYQLYCYTLRQSLSFFQNDFSGRLANKIQQAGYSLRNVVMALTGSIWFAAIFTLSNLILLSLTHAMLALPLFIWLVLYVCTLYYYTPKIRHLSHTAANDFSAYIGQVVDTMTNALPVKYFTQRMQEEQNARDLIQSNCAHYRRATSEVLTLNIVIDILNTVLLATTALIGYWLVQTQGQVGLAAMAMALPMVLQATFQSGWIMNEVSGIFENLGVVQEGVDDLTKPHDVVDQPEAKDLVVGTSAPAIAYRAVTFRYDRVDPDADNAVLQEFVLDIPPGQKLGLVGRSGAGKTTLTNLLLRAYDIEGGEILVNGQDISAVTQDSLRRQITIVTQDSYLFHRSIFDNISYGKTGATSEEVIAAAKKAHAHDFIVKLEDNAGRKGYDAHVGERGVKLSGGQKQRIAIARAILKDAPILILDEATSALDSESEQAIQSALADIMRDKTVIAIAHRLSTLRQMDRIIVLEDGKIIEDGTHHALLRRKDGHYARLWHMQSGGFLHEDV